MTKKLFFVFLLVMLVGCASQVPITSDDTLPRWVAFPSDYFAVETGVGCEIADSSFTKSNLREISQHKAMIDLLKKLGGKQKMFANESVISEGVGGSNYLVEIKSKTYGSIGRNFVVKEGLVKNKSKQRSYCTAVQLLNN